MFGFGKKELKEYDYTVEELSKFNYAKITTQSGVIWIKLFNKETPNTVSNFATLANDGFYNGLNFHRVIDGFMAQGGCPDGTGAGGPDWAIACETTADKQIQNRGSLSMAHAGKDTGGSQFFIQYLEKLKLKIIIASQLLMMCTKVIKSYQLRLQKQNSFFS